MKKMTFVLLIFLTLPLFAQLDRSKMPEPGPAPEIKIGDYQSFELPNGLKVFVVENDKIPRVAFSLVLHRDPIMEKDNMGYVTIAGQLLRTGTATRTKDQIDEEVDFIGGTLNTSSTGAYAVSLKKHTDKLVNLLSDVILHPAFNQAELDKIKKQTISGLKSAQDNPTQIANNVRKVILYGKDHPYGEIETEESVNSITLDLCKNYYDTYFRPNIAYMAIVGDITKDEAEELITKYFSEWKKKDVPKFKYEGVKAPLIRKIDLVDRANSVQSTINITYPIDLKSFTDDAIKASVMNYILGGGASGKLFQTLREKKAYTYGAYSSTAPDRIVGNFRAFCDARNEVTDSAITAFIDVMKDFRNEKVPEKTLQSAKNYLTGRFSRSLERPETVASFALNIARWELPKDYYKNYLKKLNSVTADDIQAMAKKYVKPNNAYIIVVGNADEIADGIKKFSVNGKINYYDIYGNEYDPSAKKIPEGIKIDDVINSYINAIGGKDNLMNVKDKTTIMKGKTQGVELNMTISQKAPNKYFQNLDAGVMKQTIVFDGDKGKQNAMGREQELSGTTLEDMKLQAVLNLTLDYKKYGIIPELTGVETINGKECYKVTLLLPNDKKWIHYYDMNTGLKVREIHTIDTPQGSFQQILDYSDYRDVDGVKYPFKIMQSLGPQSVEMDVEKIEINTGLDDSLFEVN